MAHLITLSIGGVSAHAQITINEIEYDQSGTDVEDFVELHEPAATGMSFTGWELVLYNGQASRRNPYVTIDLSTAPGGVMPPDGYLLIGPTGVLPNVDIASPSGNWIQNGAPDGIALVNNGVVIELLAYEGSFVGNTDGTGGPAAGMMFPDIGVSDRNNADIGLQRMPDGGAWTEIPDWAATPGGPNPAAWDVLAYGRVTLMHGSDPDSGPIALCADRGTPPYTFTIETLPSNGTLAHGGGPILGAPTPVIAPLTYTADAGFSGIDTFAFTATDNAGQTSPSAVQEIGVQFTVDGVVISEVMHFPSGDPRVYEYLEIHNPTAQAVSLGRLDADAPLSANTLDNLLGQAVPSGETRIIAPDPTSEGLDLELLRCEWGLRESEIIRIPFAQWELLFSVGHAACAASAGSRLLLFDTAGNLLDAVDLSNPGLAFPTPGQSLTIDDQLLTPPGGPLDTRQNDSPVPWVNAGGAGVPGVRAALSGDLGGPMFVPSLSGGPYVPAPCTGLCCLGGGGCATVTFDDCALAGGNLEMWGPGTSCNPALDEYPVFHGCLSGPNATPPPACSTQDRDSDGDVDLGDFADLQLAAAGDPCP